MTLDKIKEVSIKQFARLGYEGTALSLIADEVGIKKQSIYSYYQSKEDLFLKLTQEVFEHENIYIASFVTQNAGKSLPDVLYDFLIHYVLTYENDNEMKFWLRFSFFPPLPFFDRINQQVYAHLDSVAVLLDPLFEEAYTSGLLDSKVLKEDAITAYLSVLDGILVELFYGGMTRVNSRLKASWTIYWRGIRNGEHIYD